ncbi:MAG: cyclic nucleotide-binding domain-containing protein [bacterium]|nr:cyclic nucleotide-binding domain-containing protein [bacterium]
MKSPTHLIDIINTHELFNTFSESNLADLETDLELIRLAPGDILCRQGDPGDVMYVVVHGLLEVVITTPHGQDMTVGTLRAGDSVGEMSLLTGQPRTATVYAKEETELIKLTQAAFYRFTDRHPQLMTTFMKRIGLRLQRTQLAGIFSRLFGDISSDVFEALHHKVEWQRLSAGECLLRQGNDGDSMYIVVNGRLQVVFEDPKGEKHILNEIGREETVGESALLTHEKRSATVYALRDSHVVKLSSAMFESLLDEFPQVSLSILRAMVRRQQRGNLGVVQKRALNAHRGMSIAFIPVHKQLPLSEFSHQLIDVLGNDTILHLNSGQFDTHFGKSGMAQIPKDHPTEISILAWLNEQETHYRFILYEADTEETQWTCRCIRQADRIVLIGDGTGQPEIESIERLIHQIHPQAQAELVLIQPADICRPSGTAQWLQHHIISTHHHVRLHEAADFRRLSRRLTNTANGLVLSGGTARGYVHVGVIRALIEAGIEIDFIGGTSMGAALGALHAVGLDPEGVFKTVGTFSSPKSLIDYTLPIASFTATKKLTKILHQVYEGARIEDLWRPFFCISTNLTKLTPVVHQQGFLWKAVRASLSMPILFSPVSFQGDVLVDGGLINNLPIDVMRKFCGDGLVIAVDAGSSSTKKGTYDFPPGLSGWKILWSKLNPFVPQIEVPRLLDILIESITVNSAYNLMSIQHQADVFIDPPTGLFDSRDWNAYRDISEVGYQTAKQQIKEWQHRTAV